MATIYLAALVLGFSRPPVHLLVGGLESWLFRGPNKELVRWAPLSAEGAFEGRALERLGILFEYKSTMYESLVSCPAGA